MATDTDSYAFSFFTTYTYCQREDDRGTNHQNQSTMKRILLPLFGALLLSLPTLARDFTFTYDGQTLTYTVLDQDAKTCQTKAGTSTDGGNNVAGPLTIPEKASDGDNYYSVIAISDYSFSGCKGLTSVTIPNSVTSIDFFAFKGCAGLTSIKIPNSVTEIGNYAFRSCTGLKSITIGNSVTSIGSNAFYDCSSLTSIKIPNSVTSIGTWAFRACTGLTSVTIGNSVTSINSFAFYGCSSLCKAEFASVESICAIQFWDVTSNPLFFAKNLYINGEEIKDLVIPKSVTSLGKYTFAGCSGLTSVTIPNSVTSIGDNAFRDCSGLTSLEIPNSVKTIDYAAFDGCSSLTGVTIPNSVKTIGASAFANCPLEQVYYAATEPISGNENIFESPNSAVYEYAILLVPEEAVDKCKQIDPWKNFANIEAHDFTGVEWLENDEIDSAEPCEVYNLNGAIVGNSTENLRTGLYIVRQGDNTSKTVVK